VVGRVVLSQMKGSIFFCFDGLSSFYVMSRLEFDDIKIALLLEVGSDLVHHLHPAFPLIIDLPFMLHLSNSRITKKYLTEWI
jgi:hypothetical protein